MKRVIAWLKSIQLARVLTVFMVSSLLVLSTGCSNKVLAKTADEIRPEVPENAVTNTYKGGMNDYMDVDPRRDTSAAEAKAKGLVDNARKNLNKRADDPDQYSENYRSGTPLGERIKNIGEDVAESAEDLGKGVTKGTQKGLENIKENAQGAPQYVKKTGQKTADADTIQNKDINVRGNAKQALNNATDAGQSIGNKIQRAAQDTSDTVQSKVNRDITNTRRAINDIADEID